ncbi:MAG: pseudouridine synthase [Xenococcaceae cyanobacterium MO_207.B15]|nr:pseudouridine synthase [Xenococcaceae cyanobacterium MO_207.B15]MDJ0741818.1 pseudouridine synthase [Xenococcaceae cyanobacterium MO_167.B27]
MKCILFYKPYEVLCQFTDNNHEVTKRKTLKDYIHIPEIYPVGRLDKDSEGLLLLTDNGRLQHRLAHRKFAHPRTYWVQVERIPDATALNKLREGVVLKDYRTRKASVKILPQEPNLPPRNPPIRYRKNVPTCWLEITLTEGRNRQVRRMTAAVGFPTLRLVRVKISIKICKSQNNSQQSKIAPRSHHFSLEPLQPGEYRELTYQEKTILQKLL